MPPSLDDILAQLPKGLWEKLRADPVRAPEYLALAAAEHHGPAVAAWAAERGAAYAQSPGELARMAKRRHAALARFGGAATGVGGFVTALPDLAALGWIQSRLVFHVAAAYGFDPHDRMRPAELLVLQDFYPDPPAARDALDGVGKTMAEAWVNRATSGEEALARRLVKVGGKHLAKRMATRMIPGVAVVTNAVGNERATRALADRAIAFYGG